MLYKGLFGQYSDVSDIRKISSVEADGVDTHVLSVNVGMDAIEHH
jgi:hypothetical protein